METIYISLYGKNIINNRTREVIRECRNEKDADLVASAMVRRPEYAWPTMDQVVQFMKERGEKPYCFTIEI